MVILLAGGKDWPSVTVCPLSQAVLLPLSLIADKPDYCTIAQTHVGKAELVRALGRGGA